MAKKRSKKKILRDKLWDTFSIYIRKRDEATCFTCDKREWDTETGEWTIKGFNAGHFIHNVLDFDEMNIHCQCIRCNHHLSGNGVEYSRRMIKKYGLEAVEELHNRASKDLKSELHDEVWYKNKIEEYKKKSNTYEK